MSYKTDFNTVYHNNVNISTNKKGGAYSAPTSMSVPSLKRNVILLSACTVAVSKSVIHKAHNETIPRCRFAEKPCAASIFAKRKRLIVSNTSVSKLSTLFGGAGVLKDEHPSEAPPLPSNTDSISSSGIYTLTQRLFPIASYRLSNAVALLSLLASYGIFALYHK